MVLDFFSPLKYRAPRCKGRRSWYEYKVISGKINIIGIADIFKFRDFYGMLFKIYSKNILLEMFYASINKRNNIINQVENSMKS